MRHDRIDTVISGANPISVTEAACERGPCPRRLPPRSRVPAKFGGMIRNNVKWSSGAVMPNIKGSDGGSLADASCGNALTWGDGASRMRPPSD